MNININIHPANDHQLKESLETISKFYNTNSDNLSVKINQLIDLANQTKNLMLTNNKNLLTIMTDLTELEAAVAKDTEVDQSAITLLNGLKAALDAAGTDPEKLKALSDKIGSSTKALADAVVANTPAA